MAGDSNNFKATLPDEMLEILSTIGLTVVDSLPIYVRNHPDIGSYIHSPGLLITAVHVVRYKKSALQRRSVAAVLV